MATEPQATTFAEKPLDNRRSMKLSPDMDERLEAFMYGLGIKTKTQAIARLLDVAAERNPDALKGYKVASLQNVMSAQGPVCITGKSGLGKSWTLRKLVLDAMQAGMSVILVDIPSKDYQDIEAKKINAKNAFFRNFKPGKSYRIVGDKDPQDRQFYIERVFQHLNILAFHDKLHEFFIAIDEGDELTGIKELHTFVNESRKFVKKAVIVSIDETLFEKPCEVMRPYSRPAS